MEFQEFNLNDTIIVQLTPKGEEILLKYYKEIEEPLQITVDLPVTGPKKPDKDGWTEFMMWKLMLIFGPHLGTGRESPFKDGIFKIKSRA